MITQETVYKRVITEEYSVFSNRLTVCVLTFDNGFMVVGESYSLTEELFDAQLGRDYARNDALNKSMGMFAFLEKEEHYNKTNTYDN